MYTPMRKQSYILNTHGARCSSVVRAFAHDAIDRRIDTSWGGPIECSTTGVTKAVVCIILSVGLRI